MKTSRFLGGLAAIAILAAAPIGLLATPLGVTQVQAQELRASFNLFFGELRPHGIWVKHPKYRYVFCPRVDADWRPYTHGRWIWLRDRGWYFDSREPFAWAVYHYGRWTHDRRIGWCWVPGNHWAPAWVSWRRSNDYIGWAPLPPERDGFQISINVNVGEPPEDDWVFVPTRRFVEPHLSVNISFGDRDRERFRDTEYVGPVIIQNNVVINNNIDIDFIQQQTNTEVKVVDAQPTDSPQAAEAEPTAETVPVFAPTVEEPKPEEAPEQAVEPEQAAEELGRPPESEQPADGVTPPVAEEGAAPSDGTQPPIECPEGQQLVDGKCVPLTDQQQPADQPAAPAEEPAAPAADQPAAPAEAPTAPAVEPAAPTDEVAPAPDQPTEPLQCPEGQQLIDGKCVPIEQQAPAAQEPAAPAEEPAAPAEEQAAPAEEAAPTDQAPADEQLVKCPEGQVLYEGKCLPIDQVPVQ